MKAEEWCTKKRQYLNTKKVKIFSITFSDTTWQSTEFDAEPFVYDLLIINIVLNKKLF